MAEPRLRFSFKVYRRAFRVPVRTSYGEWTARDGILVRVEREDGRVGFGEIAPIERFGTETIAGALVWCTSLGAMTTVARLREVPRGLPCCAAAVDAVLVDVGSPSPVEAPRPEPHAGKKSTLPVACLLPTGVAALDALTRAVEAGFTTFKVKIGIADFASEASGVARLLEQLPRDGRLRFDANGGLDVRTATRWLEAAAAWPVEFVEQPLPVAAEGDLVRLAHDHATAVALDESVRDADDIKRWRDRGWRGVFVIKPALAGATDELVREVGIVPSQFVFSSALETAIGAAAGVRLAGSAGVSRALGYGVGAFFEEDGLGGGINRPTIAANDVSAWNREAAWTRL